LADALRKARPELRIERTACLSVCAAPATLAAQGAGRATYVFSGLTGEDARDVLTFADAYLAAPAGWIEDARPLGRLRNCLMPRVPAMIDRAVIAR